PRGGGGIVSWETGSILALVALVGGVSIWHLRHLATQREDPSVTLLQHQVEALRGQVQQAIAGQSQLIGQQLAALTTQMNDRLRDNVTLLQAGQTPMGERLQTPPPAAGPG